MQPIMIPARILAAYEKLKADAHIKEMREHTAHGRTSVYAHSVSVTDLSLWIAVRTKLKRHRLENLIYAAMLHDFYLYDYHGRRTTDGFHAWRHPERALANAEKLFDLEPEVRNAIRCHMFPGTLFHMPLHAIGWIIVLADKICAVLELAGRPDIIRVNLIPDLTPEPRP